MGNTMKSSRTVVFELETQAIIGRHMEERKRNFSQIVNFLVKQADYLLKKIDLLREENERKEELRKKYYPQEKQE